MAQSFEHLPQSAVLGAQLSDLALRLHNVQILFVFGIAHRGQVDVARQRRNPLHLIVQVLPYIAQMPQPHVVLAHQTMIDA